MARRLKQRVAEVEEKLQLLKGALLALQNEDGGFRGYYCHDTHSGNWTTAEAMAVLHGAFGEGEDIQLSRAASYLVASQNQDGGWPFRKDGKSISDITAWVCLGLSRAGRSDSIDRGINFLLEAQNNEVGDNEPAWGLTRFEPDRVYSTWICLLALNRYLEILPAADTKLGLRTRIKSVISEARAWLLREKLAEGEWLGEGVARSSRTSTALALDALFSLGADPKDHEPSYKYLIDGMKNGYWNPERDLVITREGYELTQEWFTTAVCFRTLLFFTEAGVNSLSLLDDTYENLLGLICEDGRVTRLPGTSRDFVWTIPKMIDCLLGYRRILLAHGADFEKYWQHKQREAVSHKKTLIVDLLRHQFPYPIARAFFAFEHELDSQRKFALLLQFYEVLTKYMTVIALAGHISSKAPTDSIRQNIDDFLGKPSLGDWLGLLSALLRHSPGPARILEPLSIEDLLKRHPCYLEDDSHTFALLDTLNEFVSLRNATIGHGAMKSIHEYRRLIDGETDRLFTLVHSLRFLAEHNSFLVLAAEYDEFGEEDVYTVRIFKGLDIADGQMETPSRLAKGQEEGGVRYVYFQNNRNNLIVNLYPFLSYMHCEECKAERFFFYNSVERERVNYLSFDCGHLSARSNVEHFQKRFRAAGVSLS
ncbi:MAG: prenyltransferase/squalene oxidase repeat-containing protein [Thermoanaerobaculia bacterium]